MPAPPHEVGVARHRRLMLEVRRLRWALEERGVDCGDVVEPSPDDPTDRILVMLALLRLKARRYRASLLLFSLRDLAGHQGAGP